MTPEPIPTPFALVSKADTLGRLTAEGRNRLDLFGVRVALDPRQLATWQANLRSRTGPLRRDYPPISVLKIDGRFVIVDGNHRAAAALRDGKHINARLLDVDRPEHHAFLRPPVSAQGRL